MWWLRFLRNLILFLLKATGIFAAGIAGGIGCLLGIGYLSRNYPNVLEIIGIGLSCILALAVLLLIFLHCIPDGRSRR
jgi:hypothetical protein